MKRVNVSLDIEDFDRLVESELLEQLEGVKEMYRRRRGGMGFAFKDIELKPDLQHIDRLVQGLMHVIDYNTLGYDLDEELEAWEQEKALHDEW